MRISSITLNNYRLYYGANTISFPEEEGKNIYLICGENGYGKTTFLHSLLWCLYGKAMTEVDDSIKKEINARGGYNIHLETNLNNKARKEIEGYTAKDIVSLRKSLNLLTGKNPLDNAKYSISIEFEDVFVPSIQCKSIIVTRQYDTLQKIEDVQIFIDGKTNELTEEIGNEIFINDFILNRDIARFFFFDSERIVSLAEVSTIDDRRKLSSAYNQVLGVKKYEDLKRNLENLRLKFRRRSGDIATREKLEALLEKKPLIENDLTNLDNMIADAENALVSMKQENDTYQDQLFREGNSATMEKIKQQERVLYKSKEMDEEYKRKLKAYFDLAPFAIAGGLMTKTRKQLESDYKISQDNQSLQNQNILVDTITSRLRNQFKEFKLTKKQQEDIIKLVDEYKTEVSSKEQLIDVTKEDYEVFMDVSQAISSSYKIEFERLIDDYKKNRQRLDRANKSIYNYQTKESDEIIQSIRNRKNAIEAQIVEAEQKIRSLHEQKGEIGRELNTLNKNITELSKHVSLDGSDLKKDKLAEELVGELSQFLSSLKQEKKYSLERRIKGAMNELMHKDDFIGNVEVVVDDDGMDVRLYAPDGSLIRKDSLSKGEQQLYATSLLKALVDESGILFPVFIDSPLQKFDKGHSDNIILDFYPNISKQVVLFPLLHKELTESELDMMKPMLNTAYLIRNNGTSSYFENVPFKKIMEA